MTEAHTPVLLQEAVEALNASDASASALYPAPSVIFCRRPFSNGAERRYDTPPSTDPRAPPYDVVIEGFRKPYEPAPIDTCPRQPRSACRVTTFTMPPRLPW